MERLFGEVPPVWWLTMGAAWVILVMRAVRSTRRLLAIRKFRAQIERTDREGIDA